MPRLTSVTLALALGALSFTGCETTGQNTLLGAGTGAGIAAASGHSALRGAAIGAGAGYVFGRILKHERRRAYQEAGYPVARRSRPGFVYSPYEPHYEIDVRDFPSGSRVIDPSCERIFINP
jgi:hypothetical protein